MRLHSRTGTIIGYVGYFGLLLLALVAFGSEAVSDFLEEPRPRQSTVVAV